MINQLIIQNYQSHKKSTLDFHSGVNIIIGPSDSGKTAILRSLRWLIWNRPGGDAFRSTWGGDTVVTLKTTDNNTIIRAKHKDNLYKLNDLRFIAFATDVPKEIKEALNVSDINFQTQFDQPFLLTNSPGEVAAHFNKIAHIDQIDTSNKKINSWIQDLKTDIKKGTTKVEELEAEIKEFEYLEKMEIDIEALEEVEKQLSLISSGNSKLQKLIDSITEVENEIEEISGIFETETLIDSILALYAKQELLTENKAKLEYHLAKAEAINSQLIKYESLLSIEPIVDAILALIKQQEAEESKKENLAKLLDSITYNDTIIKQAMERIKTLQAKFAKEMGDTCILCGQPINTHTHET